MITADEAREIVKYKREERNKEMLNDPIFERIVDCIDTSIEISANKMENSLVWTSAEAAFEDYIFQQLLQERYISLGYDCRIYERTRLNAYSTRIFDVHVDW